MILFFDSAHCASTLLCIFVVYLRPPPFFFDLAFAFVFEGLFVPGVRRQFSKRRSATHVPSCALVAWKGRKERRERKEKKINMQRGKNKKGSSGEKEREIMQRKEKQGDTREL